MKVHGIELREKAEEVRYLFQHQGAEAEEYTVLKFVNDKQVSYTRQSGEVITDVVPESPEEMIADFPEVPYLEVQASDLPYLVKPEGEWEFRKFKVGDTAKPHQICTDGRGETYYCYYDAAGHHSLSGYRWCKPREVVARTYDECWDSLGPAIQIVANKAVGRLVWDAAIASTEL